MRRSASQTRRWKRLPATSSGTVPASARPSQAAASTSAQRSTQAPPRASAAAGSSCASVASSAAAFVPMRTWQTPRSLAATSSSPIGVLRIVNATLRCMLASSRTQSGVSRRSGVGTRRIRTWPGRRPCPKTASQRPGLGHTGGVLPEFEICYRALSSRDARFDGRFFTGVASTGVYCRPICPARTPLARNCRFFASAAAAAQAGFRPCRRCRPEAAPGSPAWQGSSAAVTRALRLLNEGALDGVSVDALAARVGTGGRQLRRLFEQHLGASPLAVAQTRRVHFAKKLLDESELPITEIAHAAGFASLRRFNAAMREAFHAAPRELRRGRRAGRGGASLELRLAARPPFDGRGVLAYLAVRALPGVEEVDGAVYRRSVRIGGESGVIAVSLDAAGCG